MEEKLRQHGFVIFPEVMLHCIETLNINEIEMYLMPKKHKKKTIHEMHSIFKHGKSEKRFQASIPFSTSDSNQLSIVVKKIISFMEPKFRRHNFVNPVLLKSLPGCEVQPAHSDYPPVQENMEDEKVEVEEDGRKLRKHNTTSFGLICAIMPNTKFTIWPGLTNRNLELTKEHSTVLPLTLNLNAGDVLLFSGDQIHAGSAYENLNYRIHMYVDGKTNKMENKNKTWLAAKHGPQPNRCVELIQCVKGNDFKNFIRVIKSPDNLLIIPEFYEWDSLTLQEKNLMQKDGGIQYFATSNLDPLQGSANPYPPPHAYTRRCDFKHATKCIWFKGSYYLFSIQSKEVKEKLNNSMLMCGLVLFWVLEKNPKTQQEWSYDIQIPVVKKILPTSFFLM